MKDTDHRPVVFNSESIQNLVATQNKLIKFELVSKLGIVESGKLEAVLSVDSKLRPRAVACHEAVLGQVAGTQTDEEVSYCLLAFCGVSRLFPAFSLMLTQF